jgi:DNA-binding MarR family transcriptional regulator
MKPTSKTNAASASTDPTPNAAGDTAPALKVLRRFRVVFNAVKTHFRQIEKQAGIGGAQLWALSVVAAQPDIRVNDLALAMDVHQSTASNLVKALTQLELIVAAKSDGDRRVVTLRVLPKGRKVLRAAPGPFAGVLPEALASLDARTLARLDKDLEKLVSALHVTDEAAKTPLAQL